MPITRAMLYPMGLYHVNAKSNKSIITMSIISRLTSQPYKQFINSRLKIRALAFDTRSTHTHFGQESNHT